MASTRNKNTCGDYYLERQQDTIIMDNRLYENRRLAYHTAFPDAGINVGHMPNTVLSNNATDLESSLFGIGSTNLTQAPLKETDAPHRNPHQWLKKLPSVAFFERMPVYMPEPLVIEKNQRPDIL
jgi:hypothetical protein